MNNKLPKDLLKQIGLWARQRGIKRPTSQNEWKMLVATYMAEQMAAQAPAWNEIPDDHQTHLVDNGATVSIVDAMRGDPDDFDELVARRERAMVEGGGDDLSRDAIMQESDRAALNAEAPWTRTAPPSAVGAILGGSINVKASQFAGVTLPNSGAAAAAAPTVAYWQGESDTETTPVTCTFSPLSPPSVAGGGVTGARPYGVIKFGTRGMLSTMFVDILNGAQVTVSGSQVILQVGIDPIVGDSTYSQTFAGMLSFRPTAIGGKATRTVYCGVLGASATSALFLVPPFAKSVLPVWTQRALQPLTVLFNDQFGNCMYDYKYIAGSETSEPLPVSGEISTMQVQSGAGGIDFSSLVFQLAG